VYIGELAGAFAGAFKLSTDKSPPAGVVFGIGEQFSGRILDQAENIVLKIHPRQGAARDFGGDLIHVATCKIQGLDRHKAAGGIEPGEVLRNFDPEVSQEIDPLEVTEVFTALHTNKGNSFAFPLPSMPTGEDGNNSCGGEKLNGSDVDHDGGMRFRLIQQNKEAWQLRFPDPAWDR
jgi:hypothetical protein